MFRSNGSVSARQVSTYAEGSEILARGQPQRGTRRAYETGWMKSAERKNETEERETSRHTARREKLEENENEILTE